MSTSIAIALGALAGFIGFVPMFVALRLSRKVPAQGTMEAALFGLAGTFVSLIIVIVALIMCRVFAADSVLPFGVAELVTLIVVTCGFVLYKNVLQKRKQK